MALPPFIAGIANGLAIHHLELIRLWIVGRVGHKRLQAAKHDWFAYLLQPAGRWLSWHVIECRALVIGAAQGPALCCMGMRRRRPPPCTWQMRACPASAKETAYLQLEGGCTHPCFYNRR